jgi:Helix-hairpin-helix containing domain
MAHSRYEGRRQHFRSWRKLTRHRSLDWTREPARRQVAGFRAHLVAPAVSRPAAATRQAQFGGRVDAGGPRRYPEAPDHLHSPGSAHSGLEMARGRVLAAGRCLDASMAQSPPVGCYRRCGYCGPNWDRAGFGEKVFDVIEAEPYRLHEVNGIGRVRASRITAAWAEQKIVREIMVLLHSHGVGTARAVRIFKTYGADAVQVMSENPYRLARDICGIGFKTADAIAMMLGIEKTAIIRVRAGISYALTEAMDDGHAGCRLTRLYLSRRTAQGRARNSAQLLKLGVERLAAGADASIAHRPVLPVLFGHILRFGSAGADKNRAPRPPACRERRSARNCSS